MCWRPTPAHLLAVAPVAGRRLKMVADAGNGMAGTPSSTEPHVRLNAEDKDVENMEGVRDGVLALAPKNTTS